MKRYIVFLDPAAGMSVMLPVTPSGYEWASRASIETVAVDQLGDLNLFGGTRMAQTTLRDCLLPAQEYPFLSPGEVADPWRYVQRLGQWISSGTPVRFIVSGTPVNAEVLIEELTYREQDGTNDLYADITIRQYRRPETPRLSPAASASTALTRDNATGAAEAKTYTVVRGDTMWGISRRFYGDGSLAWRLADFNQIKNANLIYPGQVLRIPAKSSLPG